MSPCGNFSVASERENHMGYHHANSSWKLFQNHATYHFSISSVWKFTRTQKFSSSSKYAQCILFHSHRRYRRPLLGFDVNMAEAPFETASLRIFTVDNNNNNSNENSRVQHDAADSQTSKLGKETSERLKFPLAHFHSETQIQCTALAHTVQILRQQTFTRNQFSSFQFFLYIFHLYTCRLFPTHRHARTPKTWIRRKTLVSCSFVVILCALFFSLCQLPTMFNFMIIKNWNFHTAFEFITCKSTKFNATLLSMKI